MNFIRKLCTGNICLPNQGFKFSDLLGDVEDGNKCKILSQNLQNDAY